MFTILCMGLLRSLFTPSHIKMDAFQALIDEVLAAWRDRMTPVFVHACSVFSIALEAYASRLPAHVREKFSNQGLHLELS